MALSSPRPALAPHLFTLAATSRPRSPPLATVASLSPTTAVAPPLLNGRLTLTERHGASALSCHASASPSRPCLCVMRALHYSKPVPLLLLPRQASRLPPPRLASWPLAASPCGLSSLHHASLLRLTFSSLLRLGLPLLHLCPARHVQLHSSYVSRHRARCFPLTSTSLSASLPLHGLTSLASRSSASFAFPHPFAFLVLFFSLFFSSPLPACPHPFFLSFLLLLATTTR